MERITYSKVKSFSIERLSALLGISIMFTGRSKTKERVGTGYWMVDDEGDAIAYLGGNRREITYHLCNCFTASELHVKGVRKQAAVLNEECVAKVFLFDEHKTNLDNIQDGKYNAHETGHDSVCDLIRACYNNKFIKE